MLILNSTSVRSSDSDDAKVLTVLAIPTTHSGQNGTDHGAATRDFPFQNRQTSPLPCIGLFVAGLVSGCGLPQQVPVRRISPPNEFLDIPVVSKCSAIRHVYQFELNSVNRRHSDRFFDLLSHKGGVPTNFLGVANIGFDTD